jgi:CSLREA domain-containing protein
MTSARLAIVVAIAASLGGSPPAFSAGFLVNTAADGVDATPGDGTCETASGNGSCTLRAAIMEANALAGADVVTLPPGTYPLDRFVELSATDTEADGDLDVTDTLDLVGAGAAVTHIHGRSELYDAVLEPHRVLDVATGTVVRVSALTIRGGMARLGNGGGINNAGDLTLSDCVVRDNRAGFYHLDSWDGGGIANGGTLAVSRCTISGNRAVNRGGGIMNAGTATIEDSTITANVAIRGGGVANMGTLTVRNSTVSANAASPDVTFMGSLSGVGAGMVHLGGNATLEHVTVANNVIETGFSAGFNLGGLLGTGAGLGGGNDTSTIGYTIRDTIVAGNTGPEVADGVNGMNGDCGAPAPSSLGHNIDGDGTCMLTGTGDQPATDPGLGPLQDNGGPTATHAIAPGSPPHDAGDAGACPPADQRGVPRPQDAGCDIGAYESNFPCGNGMLDAGEACDDGNPSGDDCCSIACEFVASGVACGNSDVCSDGQCDGAGACLATTYAPAGTACTLDADPCTLDQCDGAGTCAPAGPMICPPCEQCDFGNCEPAPRTDCRQPTVDGAAAVVLKPDRIIWRWTKGESTEADDFGNPATADDYTLCIFETRFFVEYALVDATLPAGATCGGNECWTPLGTPPGARGWRYRDATRSRRGLDSILMKPGADGQARIIVKGKGSNVGLPTPLGIDLPLTVQLQRDGGACWEASYGSPTVRTDTLFKAKSNAP